MSELNISLPDELTSKSTSKLLGKALIKLIKDDILERYKLTREVTDDDWEFCEKIDWHPVDELPPKKEHVEELKKRLKEKFSIERIEKFPVDKLSQLEEMIQGGN